MHRVVRGVAGLQAPDDFHQGHHGHGVEEVHANETVSTLSGGGQLRDRNRRGVGRDDHVGGQQTVELLQDLDLEFVVFGGGFDDQLGTLEVFVVAGALDAGQRGGFVGLTDFFFLDQTVQAAGHGGHAFGHGRVRNIDHHHLDARNGARLCNAIAHGACANDAYGLDAHVFIP